MADVKEALNSLLVYIDCIKDAQSDRDARRHLQTVRERFMFLEGENNALHRGIKESAQVNREILAVVERLQAEKAELKELAARYMRAVKP